ncbi:hypothetical protein CAOG_05018 [Capsaspora owczarzaki ATCC 30864]|uniref:PX domain-containing protein n=1 Tax=Capsaspora owczarzaki (strain ATCC 30864) TaxID=595528 RepID=A0A0D2WSF0_CAPO3|nr:hypothetical protein CAOG_05018 [Capsaspora owczarzaki ATCC 30864]KJE94368.1 hypothetical protein CAOG_005018 [Capsaspora owczarzaki ATCC 30864]|eukprot:XP_004346703.1 hypothetical protein CAOG_05018 [Capsaspora owczarzaki ATCC 30864]
MADEDYSPATTPSGSPLAGLEISIADAEKRKKSGEILSDPFIAYNIISKSKQNVPGFGSSEYYVWRRYSEFELLRNYLYMQYPTVVLPPMPPKRGNAGWTKIVDHFDPEFIEVRRVALQSFLRRAAQHPQLAADETFHAFLQQEAWSTSSAQLADRVEEKMKQLSASLKLKTQDNRFLDVKNYADNLNANLSALVKVQERLSKNMADMYESYGQTGPVFSDWAVIEKDIGDVLQSTGHFMDSLAPSVNEKLHAEEDQFTAVLREYTLFGDSLRTLVKRQEQKQYDLEKAEDSLASKVSSLEQLQGVTATGEPAPAGGKFSFKKISSKMFGPDTPEVREEKIRALEQQIEEGKGQVQIAQQELSTFCEDALRDVERFHKTKVADFKRVLVQYAKTQISFYKKGLQSWENMRTVVNGM